MQSFPATVQRPARDHGGNLSAAIAQYGGTMEGWLDLSTGINPHAYPLGPLPARAFSALPDAGRLAALCAVARKAYGVPDAAGILPAPGAQALIEALPKVLARLPVSIASPTYNEHAACFRAHGFEAEETTTPTGPIRLVVNPNNPDGRCWGREVLQSWLDEGAIVIVDESFADAEPGLSLADLAGQERLIILRSFGKFYGLAGLRLGFALGEAGLIERLGRTFGLWAVSGPAIEAGIAALADTAWQAEMQARLADEAQALHDLLISTGAECIGQTPLFVTVAHDRAAALHKHLAHQHIWTRVFPYAPNWLRLGLPGNAQGRLAAALASF
ncbi:threonine-phosphate decarboxylase CobD [Abyssibius alkaniclasticus]|uniref:threonine-phosphate decarboxylase CobD n=1 Tax=Abyssibius alkaniclasticus TaxID=2881234 RepID=UPI00405A137C